MKTINHKYKPVFENGGLCKCQRTKEDHEDKTISELDKSFLEYFFRIL